MRIRKSALEQLMRKMSELEAAFPGSTGLARVCWERSCTQSQTEPAAWGRGWWSPHSLRSQTRGEVTVFVLTECDYTSI